MIAYTIDFNSIIKLSDEQFYKLCRHNPDIKFERKRSGEIIVMSPTGGETGNRNVEIAAEFVIWNRQTKLGKVFDSSTCFKLPDGANRSPDVAWVSQQRWDNLTTEQQEKFPPIAPDFVLELMSPSDSLKDTQDKMKEYKENGVKLGWLIDRKNRGVEIYRLDRELEILEAPTNISGENILPGFVLDFSIVW